MNKVGIGAALLAVSLAACSGANTTTIAPVTTSNTNATMQLAVGTLNDSGLFYGAGTWLNAVTTFRNPTGTAAFFHPSTTGKIYLTGPGGLNENLGNLFAYGQAAGVDGTLGEPPAFSPQNLVGGYSDGYILTGAAPAPGTYNVATTVSVNGKDVNFSASATLPGSPSVLPAEPLAGFTSDGQGGGTVSLTNPPGVTESLVWIQASNGAYVASVEVKSPATTATVPDGMLTAGATYYIFNVGADYPLVEAAPPNNTQVAPMLTGSNGTADLTTSWYTTFTE